MYKAGLIFIFCQRYNLFDLTGDVSDINIFNF